MRLFVIARIGRGDDMPASPHRDDARDVIFRVGIGKLLLHRAVERDAEQCVARSEEHTSETPVTNAHLVCRLLLEKKKEIKHTNDKTKTRQTTTKYTQRLN